MMAQLTMTTLICYQCDVMQMGCCWPVNYSWICTVCSFYSTLESLQNCSVPFMTEAARAMLSVDWLSAIVHAVMAANIQTM